MLLFIGGSGVSFPTIIDALHCGFLCSLSSGLFRTAACGGGPHRGDGGGQVSYMSHHF